MMVYMVYMVDMLIETRISNKQFFEFSGFGCPSFLKMAVVNINITISQKLHHIEQ